MGIVGIYTSINMWWIIIIGIVVFLIFVCNSSKRQRKKEWENELLNREKEHGPLSRIIKLYPEEESICVYQVTRTIFVSNRKLSFDNLLSCCIKSDLIKGKERYITKPDKYDLAEKQVLYGMGKNYNVKQITTIEKEPDIVNYRIFIGLKEISANPIVIKLGQQPAKANEICALINAIIHKQN
jgi:hypothetical protein